MNYILKQAQNVCNEYNNYELSYYNSKRILLVNNDIYSWNFNSIDTLVEDIKVYFLCMEKIFKYNKKYELYRYSYKDINDCIADIKDRFESIGYRLDYILKDGIYTKMLYKYNKNIIAINIDLDYITKNYWVEIKSNKIINLDFKGGYVYDKN